MQELNQAEDIKQLTEKVKEQNVYFSLLKKEINRAIIGQEYMVDRLLIGLLGNGTRFAGRCSWFGKNFSHQNPFRSGSRSVF